VGLNRELILRQLGALVWTTDADLRIRSVHGRLADEIGAAEAIGSRVEDYFPDPAGAATSSHLKALHGESAQYSLSTRGRTWTIYVQPLRDASELLGCIATAVDTSEQAVSTRALEEAEKHYRSLVENLPLVIYTRTLGTDSQPSRAFAVGGQVEAVIGVRSDAADPARVDELIHPGDLERIAPLYQEADRLGVPLSLDYRLLAPDGRTIWVHDESCVVRDEDGTPLYAQGYLQDVTAERAARNEAARALERERAARIAAEEAEAATVATVERMSDAFMSFDRELRLRYVNAQAAAILGSDPAELIGRTPQEIAGTQHSSDVLYDALVRGLAGESVETDYASPAFARTFELRAHPAPTGVWLFGRDVTERRRLEERLRQAQKMEAVGQLAGGIAHDFNNLLTAIVGYADVALGELGDSSVERLRAELSGIKQTAARAAELTHQLLALSRRQVMQPRVLDLNVVVADAAQLLRSVLGGRITVVTETAGEVPYVEADAAQLEQVLVSLALNARDAMPEGGTLRLCTSRRTVLGEEAGRLDIPPGEYAALSVADTGHGIPAEIRGRIFDPFFTTKPFGVGTGLGLAAVHGVVRQSGGTVELESPESGGSLFHLYLPAVSDGEPTAAQPQHEPPSHGSAGERILFVEDEPVLRELVPEMLAARGYDVTVAADGPAALALMAEEPFDLLVTDVVMPGMSGVELAEHVREQRPGVGVLFISGYTDSIVDEHRLSPTMRFLAKPFSTDELAGAVREIIAAGAAEQG
jgi:two-component system, cell cycle sensor histidine kinase and response regulator CckA